MVFEVALYSFFLTLVAEQLISVLILCFGTSNSLRLAVRFATYEYNNGRSRLLLVGGLHKRLGFNFNNSLLVFVSVFLPLPNSLQRYHFCVVAPAGNTEIFLLVSGSHHKFHR